MADSRVMVSSASGLPGSRGMIRDRATAEWIAGTLAAGVLLWLAFSLFTDWVHISVDLSERVRSGEDVASSVARLFAALALGLVPREEGGRRLHWLAAGFLVLGLGQLAFGYVQPVLQGGPTPIAEGRLEAFLVRGLAGLIFAAALLPVMPPRITAWAGVTVSAVVVGGYVLAEFAMGDWMAALAVADRSSDAARLLTEPAWWVTLAYIGLAFTAAVGANRQHRVGNLRDWLLIALVFWAGSLLHDALWPPSYSAIGVTTGDLLRLAFTVSVAVGAVIELRRIAAERARLLAAEREYSNRLAELSQLRADFNAMVIHELGAPASTIRNFTEVLASGGIRPTDQAPILTMIRGESERMLALIDDVQSTAAAEREEFSVVPRPLPVAALLADATAFAGTLPGER
ncbi:MAG: hypothetical protein H0W06_02240, partial [Chloroflexia bacterium]|nr:hypothetical protein [Chloroflexia bacterium]